MTLTAQKTSYVTTSIPYVNANPHLGFALELCVADAFARHRRTLGRRVRFVTGTDDHSLKNVLAAERAGVPTAQWVADHAAAFEALNAALGISADDFQRTSANPAHAPAVRALWEACARRGDLYRRPYRGLYCVGCERFYDPEELDDGRCPEHDAALETVEETNWFFRLSRYAGAVREAIESGRLRIVHDGAREETLAFLRGPVRDISVSRSAGRARGWALPVPGDPSQVIWVWFDALCGYIAALGYGGSDRSRLDSFWCGDGERVHVIGKGIARFHAVYWPAFLDSAGLAWPTDLLVHGYVTIDGEKISKSGRTIDPTPLIAQYGSDAVRYFLLRHIRTARDGDFSIARFHQAPRRGARKRARQPCKPNPGARGEGDERARTRCWRGARGRPGASRSSPSAAFESERGVRPAVPGRSALGHLQARRRDEPIRDERRTVGARPRRTSRARRGNAEDGARGAARDRA